MPLTITSRTTDRIPIIWRGLTPSSLAGQSLTELARIPISHGNRQIPMGELFVFSGSTSDCQWRLEGDFRSVHYVGAGMTSGKIHAIGPVGRHLGSRMKGGQIIAEQDVGDHLGAEMRGGFINVAGNAGDHVGAAYIGSKSGMRAGTIVIEGNVGTHAGYAMRRGSLIVKGNCGDWPAYRMRGGTLIVGGTCGERPGAELRRGTILLAGSPPPLLPTFRYACHGRPIVLGVLTRELRTLGIELPLDPTMMMAFYNGDLNEGGRGELLVAER